MARRNSAKRKPKKSKYTDLEKLAYKMGQIGRGLKNDSLVKDSYERGLNPVEKVKPVKKKLLG